MELQQELHHCKTGVGSPSVAIPDFTSPETIRAISSAISEKEIASNETSRPSQTIETAFVPCEGCHRSALNLF